MLAKFNEKLEKLIEFVLEKKKISRKILISLLKNSKIYQYFPTPPCLGVQQISFTSLKPPLA